MWQFYTVSPDSNNSHLSDVHEWYQRTPELLKANWQFEDNKIRFIEDIKNGINFIGTIDGKFVAMVHGEHKEENVVEGHLFCKEKLSKDFLVMLVTFSKNQALKTYKTVLTQTPIKHKGMLEINYRSGFIDTGIRSWGIKRHKGRLLEIQHSIAIR